ncbi:hypothetical protein BV394_00630 [Brevirhabdus pacifica]|uniref:Uncharacterized protein n=1 Tax=Brevirhabdus pacifica TaxID=1267768 RepID=A0A1U7DEJ7_9RHOB|nr:RsmB/NOP family class I SAM-dependent RNA methyltransferase [Brevirhabdus pacifica]APX88417.1 hypothetical protein BV394_00630 [Brevirhabdus pacifica]OWU79728.1 hypothetical protein ATO5_01325 [Loktanella sp. 22II-4b]PJJ87119.1 16S rRNA (cytosine967-C5)-methyltransferase [Brevirhabdus pacifica]
MTPAARVASAAAILDRVAGGEPAERALTNWARSNRYAGSGDRAAIRDLVFGVLRRWRSAAAHGAAPDVTPDAGQWADHRPDGRRLMLGDLVQTGEDPAAFFTGDRFALGPLSDEETAAIADPPAMERGQRLDCPDWMLPILDADMGDRADEVLLTLRERSPVGLRVNLARISREEAITALAQEGITAQAHPLSPSALVVDGFPRGLAAKAPLRDGLIEMQDPASQAVVDLLPLDPGMRVLDYCAGGGGKTLAMAGRARAEFHVHDADPGRMADLAPRAERAGVPIAGTWGPAAPPEGDFDLVLCDAPCSGSGAWRRSPEGKWALTPARLDALRQIQGEILDRAAALTRKGGTLAYATCSLLRAENEEAVAAFLSRDGRFRQTGGRRFSPLEGGDGFFVAILERQS